MVGPFPLAAHEQSSSTQHQWPAFLLLACPLQNTAAKWAEMCCWVVVYFQKLLHFASFFWSRRGILFGTERCFSTLLASKLPEEVRWQGTDKDMTAFGPDTAHRAGSCSHTSGAQGSPITLLGSASTTEPPIDQETPGRAGLFLEPLAWQWI